MFPTAVVRARRWKTAAGSLVNAVATMLQQYCNNNKHAGLDMATITVLNTNDSGTGSLRQAIADALAGDTIVFDSTLAGGTIELESELLISKALTITGPVNNDGAPDLTLDGGTSNSRSGCRCVHATASVTMNNLVIANGFLAPDLTNADDTYDIDEYGAGFYADYALAGSSVATLNNCEITHCNIVGLTPYVYANAYGLNVAVFDGVLNMTDCVVSGEYTDSERIANGYSTFGGFRGVLYAFAATVNLTRVKNTCCHYQEWTNTPFYGFVLDECLSNLTNVNNMIKDETNNFYNNGGWYGGGGVFITGGSVSITDICIGNDFSLFGIAPEMFPPPNSLTSLTVNGYNYLGYNSCQPLEDPITGTVSGGVGAVSGSGYIASVNLLAGYNSDDDELTDIFGSDVGLLRTGTNPAARLLSGDIEGLTWLPNGQTMLEKLVNGAWQKVTTITDYVAYEDLDNPGTDGGGLLDEYPQQWPYIPMQDYPPRPDPKDPSNTVIDPATPLIPNPVYPVRGGAIFNPYPPTDNPGQTGNWVDYAIETEHTTTYRVWDGANFLTYTVEVDEPEPPEPEPAIAVRPGLLVTNTIQYLYANNTGSKIQAGKGIQQGKTFGVSVAEIDDGDVGALSAYGMFNFPCSSISADAGAIAYWDAINDRVTTSGSGLVEIGVFVKAVTSSETSCRVSIFPTGKTSAMN